MDWLVDGWQRRTQQKLAFAGCMAALLSLRSDPLRTTSRLRDFAQKLVGYGGAAIIFSGIQETCRAVRGHHDFLNSALSGAVTGALVVGHYQGPQYRLLGVVTWGSLGAVLHIANSVLEPRHYIEDYLIREGLLSPIAARYRQAPAQRPSSEVGLLFPEYEHRDILLAAKEIKERELRQINDRAAAATAAAARPIGDDREGDIEGDIPDDDPGYQAWLRTSGFEADVLLQSQPQQQQQQQQQQQTRQQTEQQQQLLGLAAGATGGGGEAAGESDGSGSRAGAGASGGDEAAAAPEVKARGCCEGACLLLRRSEDSGNPGTWGLPGGNADAADGGQLLTTAMREAREELGELPPGLEVLGSVLTRRGKSLQKHYTVFVASIPGAARAAYRPTLNDEHTEWRWLDLRHAAALAAAPGAPAHCPTGPGFLGDPDDDEAAAAAAGPPTGNMVLHPVVRVMFGGAHAEALGSMLPSVGAKPGAEQ